MHRRRRDLADPPAAAREQRLAQQTGREAAGLHRARTRHGQRAARDQLRGDARPRRIPVAFVRGEAGQARRAPRQDGRSHRDASAVEHDRDVGDVVGHEIGRQVRRDEVMREQHDGVRLAGRVAPRGGDARHAHRLRDIGARRPVDAVRAHERGAQRGPGAVQGDPHALQERRELGGTHVEHGGEPLERDEVDTPFQLVEEALLPRLRIGERGHRSRAELERRLVAPQEWEGRVEP
ncbi:hypothetical protein GCM10010921_00070 [Microbacterium album]|uniref:Uncharacterized protein n=1 Tax=Microbacterium album TaxID=2053191 RepID=A0A917IC30_9MICO|nr:hypothetical protein GCM10010921_00070 [Microbacterium album]